MLHRLPRLSTRIPQTIKRNFCGTLGLHQPSYPSGTAAHRVSNASRAILILTTVPVAIYAIYSYTTDPYPPQVRAPLKHALFLKHKQQARSHHPPSDREFEETADSFRQAITAARMAPDVSNRRLVPSLMVEAADYLRDRRPADAVDMYAQALALALDLADLNAGLPSPSITSSVSGAGEGGGDELGVGIAYRLADLYADMGEMASAEVLFRWCIDTLIQSSDSKDLDRIAGTVGDRLVPCLDGIAGVYMRQERFETAEETYRALISIMQSPAYPRQRDCQLGQALNSLADILVQRGQISAARKELDLAKLKCEQDLKRSWRQSKECQQCLATIMTNVTTVRAMEQQQQDRFVQ